MEQLRRPDEGDGDGDSHSGAGGYGRGVPLDELPDRTNNSIAIANGETVAEELLECARDPDRDIVDPPRSRSFRFASRFGEEFD